MTQLGFVVPHVGREICTIEDDEPSMTKQGPDFASGRPAFRESFGLEKEGEYNPKQYSSDNHPHQRRH